jgi:hypothetical protein
MLYLARGIVIVAILIIGGMAQAQSLCASTGAAVVSTRGLAQTKDLTGCERVMTLSYGILTAGGASFKPAGTAPFIDSFAKQATITPGSGYPNGTYYGVALIGSTTGRGLFGVVTVSGGQVTAVDFSGTPGNAFAIGDVLAPPAGDYLCSRRSDIVTPTPASPALPCSPTGTGFSITITQVTEPRASFTDAVGNRWQYYPEPYINTAQFGSMSNSSMALPNDDFESIQAALRYATNIAGHDAGTSWGGKVYLPIGASYVCGDGNRSLINPQGVRFQGAGTYGSQLRFCASFNPAVTMIELCDPNNKFACFDSNISHMDIRADRNAPANSFVPVIHSNATQHDGGVEHVTIYAGNRMCIRLRKGYGGASNVVAHDIECNISGPNMGIVIGDNQSTGMNYGTTIVHLYNTKIQGPSSAPFATGGGIIFLGGTSRFDDSHCELLNRCIEVLIAAGATGSLEIRNVNAASGNPTPGSGGNCYAVIQLDQGNVTGNTSVSQVEASSCGPIVLNYQSGSPVAHTAKIPPGADMRFF